jgi:hypothetical protein
VSIPTQFYRGEAVTWDSTFEIPEGASALPSAYKVVLANDLATIGVTSIATSTIHSGPYVTVTFNLSAADTTTLQQGNVVYQVVLTDPGFEKVLESGKVQVQQNLALVSAGQSFDTRSTSVAEQTFAAIENYMLGKASSLELKMVLNGRELQSYPLDQLMKVRNYYARLVLQERGKGNGFARTLLFKAGV